LILVSAGCQRTCGLARVSATTRWRLVELLHGGVDVAAIALIHRIRSRPITVIICRR